MKWLSNQMSFSTEIEDPLVLAGVKEGSINIDFSKLEVSDKNNGTQFVNGGRAFFEAEVLGFKISSFTARGFFDKLNYEEPVRVQDVSFYEKYKMPIIISGAVIAVLIKLRHEKN
jgi:hypothetical protein